MSVIFSDARSYQYQMLPSAFKVAEIPTYCCWGALRYSANLLDKDLNNEITHIKKVMKERNFREFKDVIVKISKIALIGGIGLTVGAVAFPLLICSIPLTITADAIIGIAEIAFCSYQGLETKDLLLIAHRKFVLSPKQQLTFAFLSLFALFSTYRFIKNSFGSLIDEFPLVIYLLWPACYRGGQIAVGDPQRGLNLSSFNIFINGGALDLNGRRMTESFEIPIQANENEGTLSWLDLLENERSNLRRINDAELSKGYIEFKTKIFNKYSPIRLFELTQNYNQEELNLAFRKFALIVHPDKNPTRKVEAEALTRILLTAKGILDKKFKSTAVINEEK